MNFPLKKKTEKVQHPPEPVLQKHLQAVCNQGKNQKNKKFSKV
jgi:hypothetical protein